MTQSGIAKLACGKSDTCDGKEWNTIYYMNVFDGHWWAGSEFCNKGCEMRKDRISAYCH